LKTIDANLESVDVNLPWQITAIYLSTLGITWLKLVTRFGQRIEEVQSWRYFALISNLEKKVSSILGVIILGVIINLIYSLLF